MTPPATQARRQTFTGQARERWSAFRTRSVYFQLKWIVVVAYGASALATIVLAPPASVARNQIGARIMVLKGDSVMGRYFVIENDSRAHWRNVVFELGDGYQVERDLVQAREKVTLLASDFKKKVIRKRRGRQIPKIISMPVQEQVDRLTVRCSEGVAVEPLGVLQDER